MKRVYICSTVYHLLIAIVKQLICNVDADLIICREDNIDINTLHNIRTSGIFVNIISYKEIEHKGYQISWKEFFLYGKKKAIKYYETQSGLSSNYFEHKDIYIFNDNSFWGRWFNYKKFHYHLLEDGLDHYIVNPTTSIDNSKFKRINKFLGLYCGHHGNSINMIDLEVNSLKGLHFNSNIKIIEYPQKKLFQQLSIDQKKFLLKLFDVPENFFSKSCETTILLPQPLAEDGIMSHKKKIDLYSYLVKKYAKGVLYIKPHPRETEDYSSIFPQATIIPFSKIPLELFNFLPGINFTYGITAFSTSLENIDCIKNKIFMGHEWTINF